MIETHCDPDQALSDSQQQLDPGGLASLLASLIFREARPSAEMRDQLRELRDLIDQLDEEIAQKLGARMDIAERIGDYKQAHNVAIYQPERWESIMRRQLRLCEELGLSEAFVRDFMEAIHKESRRRQGEVDETAPTDDGRAASIDGHPAVRPAFR
jgi:chorismate mutase